MVYWTAKFYARWVRLETTKIMKQYPTITNKIQGSGNFYIFEKLDGSNIRAEWHPRKGFWKFGSRHVLIDRSHEFLGEAVDLIKAQEDMFSRYVGSRRWESVVAFFEFWGPNSFAGLHEKEEHHCSLIDVSVHRRGLLRPKDFTDVFGIGGMGKTPNFMDVAALLDITHVTDGLVSAVRNSEFMEHQLSGQRIFEGVVCKGTPRKPSHPPLMFKIKSNAWLDAVKERYKDDPKKLKELL